MNAAFSSQQVASASPASLHDDSPTVRECEHESRPAVSAVRQCSDLDDGVDYFQAQGRIARERLEGRGA